MPFRLHVLADRGFLTRMLLEAGEAVGRREASTLAKTCLSQWPSFAMWPPGVLCKRSI